MLSKIHIPLLSILALAMVACSDAVEAPVNEVTPNSPGSITINLSNSSMTRTLESDNSENLIENVAIGLYVDSPDETQSPVAFQTFEGFKDYNKHQVVMQLTDEMIATLFEGHGNQCQMFAVANLPAGSTIPENPTIEDLKKIPVSSNFRTLKVQPSFVMTGEGKVTYTPPTGSEKIGSASGSATLYRAAAKIRLNLQIPDTIHVGNATDFVVWEPVKNNIRALMNNGVQQAISSPVGTGDNFWKPTASTAYYNSTLIEGSERGFTNTGTGTYTYVMDVPFYTYPNSWNETAAEDRKTSLTLIVNWGIRGQESWNTFYYQIPITPVKLPHIDKNYSYTVNLKLGMLGSLTPEEEFHLEDLSYQIVDWGNENVDVDIKDFRYLVVNPNVVTFDNEANMVIPFYSSHPVELSNITMSFKRFNFYTGTNGDVVDITVPQSKLNNSIWTHQETVNGVTTTVRDTICTFNVVKDPTTNQLSLVVKHPLEVWTPVNNNSTSITTGNTVNLTGNSGTGNQTLDRVTNSINHFNRPTNPEAPYSAYTFNVHIAHKDKPDYASDITITQYPAMYIEAKRNPGGGNSDKGNVWVNAANGTGGDYGGVWGISSTASNKNPNMYVINISQLDAGSEFIIGDPRLDQINNSLDVRNNGSLTTASTNAATWDTSSTSLYYEGNNRNRHLTYYYPTEEVAQTATKGKMIAPKIRIASSFGVTQMLYRNYARRRVAVYQELGCPAGRWRLPTYSELLYIIRLSSTGKIPMLFNHYPNGDSRESYCRYWTAQGLYRINSDGTLTKADDSNTGGVKGIYDEWYWENSQYQITPDANGNYSYTLGDVPRGKQ